MLIKRFAVILFVCLVTACTSSPKISSSVLNSQKIIPPMTSDTVLGPGDLIDVKFRLWPELDYQQTIRPDGKISLQLVDEVTAAGITPQELDRHLTELYSKKLKNPEITVIVITLADQNIYVGGEVTTPGLLTLAKNMSALQAVINSGGFKETAAMENTIIIRKGPDNRPVPIPINLRKTLEGNDDNPDLILRPSDIVYVPKTSIAKANKFVKEYIQDLFLFKGISMGFHYDLTDDVDINW